MEKAGQKRSAIIAMCTFVAIVLWFIVRLTEDYTITVDLPTEVINMPADTALAVLPPATIQARVEGVGTALFGLRRLPPVVKIDGTQMAVNVSTSVTLAQSLSAIDFFPESFELHKEEQITRRIPVRSLVRFEAVETYDFFTEPTIEPNFIDVSGARSVIEALYEWPTQELITSGVRDSVGLVVPLSDTLGGLVIKSHTAVTISHLSENYTEDTRLLTVLVTGLPTATQAVQLDPSSVAVQYRVPVSQVEAVRAAEEFFATISYHTIRQDTTGRIHPDITLPDGFVLKNVDVFPRTLEYFIYAGE